MAGLDPESRTVLAEKILDAQVKDEKRIARLRKDDGFKQLMKLLAGNPLAMEVVLANLTRQTPQEILAASNHTRRKHFACCSAMLKRNSGRGKAEV